MRFFDAGETAQLLTYPVLMDTLSGVLQEYQDGLMSSPERMVVPCGADQGFLLSMPCTASDLVSHKLLTIFSGNARSGLPTIQGQVTAFDAANGNPLFCLDGPTVTARRTAAITLLGIRHLARTEPRTIMVIGTGAQALGHTEALLEVHPQAAVRVRGLSRADEEAFCGRIRGPAGRVRPVNGQDVSADVVVALTSSKVPVYDEEADRNRLVVGVGAYRLDMVEIGARLIRGSVIYVDDPVGAPGEAGDLVAAGTDWSEVKPLASALAEPPEPGRPVFLKSVGCAAWDLAACRAARSQLAG